MKITILQKDLFEGVETVLDAVPSRAALPILSNILLEASEEGLSLCATDLEVSIKTKVPAEVESSGSTTIPARKLAEIVRELPQCQLSLEVTDDRIELSTSGLEESGLGEGFYSLSGISAEEFPTLPLGIEGMVVRFDQPGGIDTTAFKRMIGKATFAVSRDETRPFLGGVLWQVKSDHMTMVATDGNRLVKMTNAISSSMTNQDAAEEAEAIVPPKALNLLVKLLSGDTELLKATLGENHVVFDLGSTVLLSRLIEGPYVDFEQVIPKDNRKKLKVLNSLLSPAVRRVSILSSSHTRQIRMSLRKDRISLSTVSQEIGGEARESLSADYSDEDFDTGYNAIYLMDILRRMDSDEVLFELDTPVSAGIIRPVGQPEGEDYFCLIMPMRLSE